MNVGVNGGRFDFDDGGTYCGGWSDGKAHGYGVCTGPKGQGEYSGAWQYGYEFSGIYLWPAGNAYEGQWMSGKRHGLGVEKKGRWIYKGEWTQGFKGRYGIRVSDISGARYEGTWANGLQDGYGVEIYADGGVYHGQIQQGLRHGFGIRRSVPYGLASRYRSKEVRESLTSLRSVEDDERIQRERDRRMDENRGGFVLRSRSDPHDSSSRSASQGPRRGSSSNSADRRTSLRKTILSKLRKQKSTSDIEDISITKKTSSFRSTASTISGDSKHSVKTATILSSHPNTPNSMGTVDDGDHSFISQDDILDNNVVETYMGEWKADKRTGFGIAERSDGLKYEGEWFNNKKNGYGVTTYRDGTREEGKYRNNVIVNDKRKPSKLFLLRSSKFRDKIDVALNNAMKAAASAQQKAEIAMARANNARSKAHSAEIYAKQARSDSIQARTSAKAADPDFRQPGEERPQSFIPLDLDRQADGKVMTGNHINFSPPNGRLPGSANYLMNNVSFVSPHLSQHPPNPTTMPSSTFPFDGGVYQGQSAAKPNEWNQNATIIGSPSSMISSPSQRSDYYRDANQAQSRYPQRTLPPTIYNDMPDSNTGSSATRSPSQMNRFTPMNNGPVPNDRTVSISTGYDAGTSSQSAPAQFVPNVGGIGPRSVQKRSTFKRTNRIEASNEDLHDTHAQQQINDPQRVQNSYDYNYPSSTLHAPQQIRHPSNLRPNTTSYSTGMSSNNSAIRPPLINGALDSRNSSGQDSGMSSGGTSFDPEQHHMRYSTAYNQQYTTVSSVTPSNYIDPYEVPPPIPIPRRKSLPSIVKNIPDDYKIDETARSTDQLAHNEIFVIENGIRKRITEQAQAYTDSGTPIPQATVMTSSTGSPALARRIILESVQRVDALATTTAHTGGSKRVSMPTLANVARQRQAAPSISREEATVLGSQRREELRRQRDRESTAIGRLKVLLQSNTPDADTKQFSSMHASDQEMCSNENYRHAGQIQNVIYRNRVFIAIFFLNLSLALWFIQLLR